MDLRGMWNLQDLNLDGFILNSEHGLGGSNTKYDVCLWYS